MIDPLANQRTSPIDDIDAKCRAEKGAGGRKSVHRALRELMP
jgi:hypothetical protein